jgi:putative protease
MMPVKPKYMLKAPELLAPARDFACGKVAVDSGADAVYMAGPAFGAREAAGNSLHDIEQLANYAHLYYARVYLTLNTILYDNELEAARKLVYEAWNAGCDALIVQDMGLLEIDLPPIPLFASTQTHNSTPEKVKFLQDVGFERVILARELSLAQIAGIRQQTTVDLECFVHGALCVCYSGQCYLSQALTGRSANRGACAQPCRALYDLLDAKGQTIMKDKHLLSLRDLHAASHLEALMEAGISSFKIEGRLKGESYVKNIVALYRREMDRLLEGKSLESASSGKSIHLFAPDAERSFCRGFTDYFLHHRNPEMTSLHTGKAIGQKVGKVVGKVAGVNRSSYLYEGEPLHNGDGICFFDAQGVLHGANVNQVVTNAFQQKITLSTGTGPIRNASIYRNHDRVFELELQRNTKRIIAARLTFQANEKQIIITATDEDTVSAILTLSQCGSPAKNKQVATAAIKTQLEKSGNSIFEFTVIGIMQSPVFAYPLALLNGWRRELTDLLLQAREDRRKKSTSKRLPNHTPYPEKTVDYKANVANELARQFYTRHGTTVTAGAFEQKPVATAELMRTKYCIKYALGACQKYGGKAQAIKEPLYLLNNGKKLRLWFDCRHCEMVITQA